MSTYQLKNIKEIIWSTSRPSDVLSFFESYGGWDLVGKYRSQPSVLKAWNLPPEIESTEYLLRSGVQDTGMVRLIHYEDIPVTYARSSQNPWDIGGIMDINLRVKNVHHNFDRLRDMGWHGLSDPLFQTLGPYKLYDVLMIGYDDVIVAFTHRVEPPLDLSYERNFPTHIYKSSITVDNLDQAIDYYVEGLQFELKSQYAFVKNEPQENMFGFPHNLAEKV